MIDIDSREIEFSEWTPWHERRRLKQPDAGTRLGVYFWGRFDQPPPSGVRPYPVLPKELIYVGETKDLDRRPLGGRHQRLEHYRDTFTDDLDLARLYVSICCVEAFPRGYGDAGPRRRYDRLRVYTQYLESKFYWEYTKRYDRRPKLLYKKGAGGSE